MSPRKPAKFASTRKATLSTKVITHFLFLFLIPFLVFGPNSSQVAVYKEVVVPIVKEVLGGYSCTIFAYGQTGTGKTYSMEGEKSFGNEFSWENDPHSGIIPRTMNHIFDELNSGDFSEYAVHVR